MRKYLSIWFILFLPLFCVFADNLVFNPGFDMTPWDTGWVSDSGGSGSWEGKITFSTSQYFSPPRSCSLYIFAAKTPSEYGGGLVRVSQYIPSVVSCTCKAYFKYRIGGTDETEGVSIQLIINNKDSTVWSLWSGWADTTLWVNWKQVYSETDTVSGISFVTEAYPYSINGATGTAIFLIDDVYISGKKVGIEEKRNINPEITISPNPFTTKTVIKGHPLQELKIYDLGGKLVKSFGSVQNRNSVCWNGTDNTGKCVPQGVYFVRLTKEKDINLKLILVR